MAGDGIVTIAISRPLLAELHATLLKPRLSRHVLSTGLDPRSMVQHVRRLSTVVTAPALSQPAARDRDDDAVLACARAAHADMIVTGDQDLLVLRTFEDIPILRPARAVALLVQR